MASAGDEPGERVKDDVPVLDQRGGFLQAEEAGFLPDAWKAD